jgi:hypothetical protein
VVDRKALHFKVKMEQLSRQNPSHLPFEVFSSIDKDFTLKIAVLTFAFVTNSINIGLAFGTICYEKSNSNDNKRTLMNKNLSSLFWSGIQYFVLCQYSDIFQFIFSPFSEQYCILQAAMKTCLKHQILMYYDMGLIVRYIFVFWLQNPSAIYDDFWNLIIRIVVVSASYILTVVIYFLPMKKPFNFYLCTHLEPTPDLHLPERLHGTFEVISLCLHVVVNLRISVFKHWTNSVSLLKEKLMRQFEKQSMVSLTTNIFCISVLLAMALLRSKIQNIPLVEISLYPNSYFVYIFQLLSPNFFALAIIMTYYLKHKPLRKWVSAQLRLTLN